MPCSEPSTRPRGLRPRALSPTNQLSAEEIAELTAYIIHREKALDRNLLPYGNPAGKDVLVFGSGYGNEVLWAARHKARSILAVDLSAGLSPVPCERAMEQLAITCNDYAFRRQNIHDTALSGDRYDLIVSNGVFEHVMDLKGVLRALPRSSGARRSRGHLRRQPVVLLGRRPHQRRALWRGALGAPVEHAAGASHEVPGALEGAPRSAQPRPGRRG